MDYLNKLESYHMANSPYKNALEDIIIKIENERKNRLGWWNILRNNNINWEWRGDVLRVHKINVWII